MVLIALFKLFGCGILSVYIFNKKKIYIYLIIKKNIINKVFIYI